MEANNAFNQARIRPLLIFVFLVAALVKANVPESREFSNYGIMRI